MIGSGWTIETQPESCSLFNGWNWALPEPWLDYTLSFHASMASFSAEYPDRECKHTIMGNHKVTTPKACLRLFGRETQESSQTPVGFLICNRIDLETKNWIWESHQRKHNYNPVHLHADSSWSFISIFFPFPNKFYLFQTKTLPESIIYCTFKNPPSRIHLHHPRYPIARGRIFHGGIPPPHLGSLRPNQDVQLPTIEAWRPIGQCHLFFLLLVFFFWPVESLRGLKLHGKGWTWWLYMIIHMEKQWRLMRRINKNTDVAIWWRVFYTNPQWLTNKWIVSFRYPSVNYQVSRTKT